MSRPLLALTDVVKAFQTPDDESLVIVDVPAFGLSRGEQVALHGPSGSGKTTFLNLIAGILKLDRGHIVIDGTDLAGLSESGRDLVRARTVGYVFQSFNLLQGYTALENVMLGMMFGGRVDAARAESLLRRVGLGHRLHYRPAQLSIGQQQRVAVARALANQPALVLADEPTGNLDQRHAGEALALIREVCDEQDAALLLVSHDAAVLRAFDRAESLVDLNRAAAAHQHTADGAAIAV